MSHLPTSDGVLSTAKESAVEDVSCDEFGLLPHAMKVMAKTEAERNKVFIIIVLYVYLCQLTIYGYRWGSEPMTPQRY